MKLSDFLNWLDSYLNFEKQQKKGIFWLESMRFLCGKLGNPQNDVPCIHIAGSKGKGSVSKMIACILNEAGYSCGLYMSPHISDFRERIGTADGFFSDKVYEDAADELYRCVSSIPAEELPGARQFTWFELVTVYSFLCFRTAGVDFAVYETGLGGRLDSTNVVLPLASVIMTIEREHTEFLGDTIEKIAGEKAGIIKPSVPVVIGRQRYPEAGKVFEKKAEKCNSLYKDVYNIIHNLSFLYTSKGLMRVKFECDEFDFPVEAKMRFCGEEQAWNAAAASVAVKTAVPSVTVSQIEQGLSKASLPGRFEIRNVPSLYGGIRSLVLDGAHTVSSIFYTVNTLCSVFSCNSFDLLFACAADKDIKDIAPLFRGKCRNITITRPGNVRASDISSVARCFSENEMTFEAQPDCSLAVQSALEKASDSGVVLLVAGSFYLLAEANEFLSHSATE